MKKLLKSTLKRILKPFFTVFDTMQIINVNAHQGIGDSFGLNFKDYMYENNMKEIQIRLEKNLDHKSIENISRKIEIFKNMPLWNTIYSKNIRSRNKKEILYTSEELEEAEAFIKALDEIKREFKLKTYIPEVVYYHHGLKLLPESVKKYIQDKVFLDCGASYGDSSTVFLKKYNPKLVKSFEMTDDPAKAEEEYIHTLNQNSISKNFEFIPKGVSNCHEFLGCPMVKIDDYLSSDIVGIIKMDIEGAAPFAIEGALETIKRDRPVMLIACYHTPKEFFEIKPFIEKLNLDYSFLYRNLNLIDNFEHETTLICIPKKLM